VLLLVIATVAVDYPVHRFPFISTNDGEYVTDNLRIQNLNWTTVRWSLTTFHAANWHPVTWVSHAVDYQLFSLDPAGHHDSNLLLHVLNALLLFWVLYRATAKAGRSFMVAALFALHPINVESVAWVAERKNLLSMLFLLLTMLAYQWYARRPRASAYLLVAFLFALALMSKPQVVTLPFLLLLWDYWPLGRMLHTRNESSPNAETTVPGKSISWLVWEKLPLFALSALCAFITTKAQRAGGAMGGALQSYSLLNRVENAIVAYGRYIGKAVWPTDLAFFYPHPAAFPPREVLGLLLLLVAITVVVIANRSRSYLVVGWFWFLGTLVPMIGIVQVGGQALADRYGYLSFVGLFIAICWGVADWADQRHIPVPWTAGASAAILLVLALVTRHQLGYWSDDLALWSHTVQVTTHNPGAETVVGELLQREGRQQEAIIHYRAASAMAPQLAYPHYHIAIYDEQQGDIAGALEQFRMVIAVTQGDRGLLADLRADTLSHMSRDYRAMGDYDNAEKCFQMAQREQRRQQAFENKSSE
jgi:tetratricopeptide (TPR) repeat protein